MKAIILIALLALTHAAVSYNSSAYFTGLTDQLGLNASQLQDAENCFTDAKNVAEGIQNLIVAAQQGEGHEVAGAILDLISSVDDTINVACVAYKDDLLAIFSQNTNGTDLKTFAEDNFNVYPTQVIQQAGLWIQYLIDGDQYNAGKTEAYIFQILFGIETPEVLPAPEFNSSNYVPIDINTYLPQIYQGIYNSMGLTNQTQIDEITTCVINYYNTILAIVELPYNVTDDITSKIHVYSNLVENLAQTVDTCTPVAEMSWAWNKKLFEIFFESPFLNFGKLALNVAKNLPEIIQNAQIAQVDILSGNYTEAGVLQGEMANTFFDGVFNFPELFNSLN